MGLDIPHEAVGKDGAASWKHTAAGTFVYIGKSRETVIDTSGFTRVLHQVRHPLKVIASMQTFSDSSWAYMAKSIALKVEADPIMKGMQAWVGWNQLAGQQACWRFQIEQLKDRFPEFCHHAGLPERPLPEVPPAAKDSRTDRYSPSTGKIWSRPTPSWPRSFAPSRSTMATKTSPPRPRPCSSPSANRAC